MIYVGGINMLTDHAEYRGSVRIVLGVVLGACLLTLFFTAGIFGDNQIYLDISETGGVKGVDTLYVGKDYTIRLYIRNDINIREMRIALYAWGGIVGKGTDDAKAGWFWTWEDVGGYSSLGCITVTPGCRMDPLETVWDVFFNFYEWNMNNISPDTLGFMGIASSGGLAAGSSQHMLSIHFKPHMPSWGMVSMWVDSAFVSPAGVVFFDGGGTPVYPNFITEGPWAISIVCGDANGDGAVNVGDQVFLINLIFHEGNEPQPSQAGDANCDGSVNIGDAVYVGNYIFHEGSPEPCCPPVK